MDVKIGYTSYKVVDDDNLRDENGEECEGLIEYDKGLISLKSTLSHEKKREVLFHEIIHGITYTECLAFDFSEDDVLVLGNLLLDTFDKNHAIFSFFKECNFVSVPLSLRIGNIDYELAFLDEVRDCDDKLVPSLIDYTDEKLLIKKGRPNSVLLVSLLELILFSIEKFACREFPGENSCLRMAQGITTFIVDNPHLIAFNWEVLHG